MSDTIKEEKQEQVTLLKKVSYLFDHKQRIQLVGLAVMILIGGVLETLSVSIMVPVVQAIMEPDKFLQNHYVSRIMEFLPIKIESGRELIMLMLGTMIVLFIVKNLYLLLQTYVQNTFVTRNRNRMISRVMREFLNRPYEEYLGADIPTVFRLTDSDIPNAFQLILVMIQMITETVVAVSISGHDDILRCGLFRDDVDDHQSVKAPPECHWTQESDHSVQDCQVADSVHLWFKGCESTAPGRIFCAQLL